jgi:nitronate monooxygenase
MFIVSSPELVVAQCRQGVLGTMPSLNVREPEQLDTVPAGIADALESHDGPSLWPIAPFGVNLIAHHSNAHLEHDLEVCGRRRAPVIITSLGPSARIAEQVHDYGGLLFHDVINVRHARKAIAAGVDGIVAVAAGAGGHAGMASPFALCAEIRDIFDGCLVLAGAISRGGDIAAVFSGVPGNYLRPSISAAGLDPDDLDARRKDTMRFGADGSKAKVWKDVWGAGHGVGAINDLPSVADLVQRLAVEYDDAMRRLSRPE